MFWNMKCVQPHGFCMYDRRRSPFGSCRYVHIGESHRGYLGTGSIDFQPFFSALAAGGYSGMITFESFSSRVVSPTLSNTLCVWRDLCAR